MRKNKKLVEIDKDKKSKSMKVKKRKRLEAIELCAGIGQTSIALEKACKKYGIDLKINAFCEIDDAAAKAYYLLHNKNIPYFRDITTASFEGLRCDVLLATTPCTSISNAGKREGYKEGSNTASSIIWNTFRIIDELKEKPKIIFFENVKEMAGKKYQEEFLRLRKELENRGYIVRYKVLDAQDYGVPQHRERLFTVCTLGYIPYDFPINEELKIFLKDILEYNPPSKYLMSNMETQINGINRRKYSVRVHNPNYARVANTLTTKSRGQSNNNYIFMNDATQESIVRFTPKTSEQFNRYKKLSIRSLTRIEQGRLMGMSDKDIQKLDCISDTQFSKQMGNGIVIPVVEKIFTKVIEALIKVEISLEEVA